MFEIGTQPLSVYLHLPLCTSRCFYCNFYSEPKSIWSGKEQQYVERLNVELATALTPHQEIHTLYIGGGDPANIGVSSLKQLLITARGSGQPVEVTLEINPESIDEELFELFEEGLVTRLSIGLQSMDDRILRSLGRTASATMNRKALTIAQQARKRWGIDLSADLMVALPFQSPEMAISDIDEILGVADIEHLSLYCLTLEEGTHLFRLVEDKAIKLYSEDDQEAFLRQVWDALSKRSFEHYEVSNFAKSHRYSQHNSVYWRVDNYLGLGCSAASTLGSIHWQQSQNFEEWITTKPLTGYEKESITLIEQIEEYLMMSLRTQWGSDKRVFKNRFGLSFDRLFSHSISTLDNHWYNNSEQFFIITEDGWMVLDEILLRLIMQIPESLDPS